ncbi:glycine/D-amino acid oxidase-like deaminating enzyme [Variovorax paradoxus]|uniref:Glycine/D-amino acid oxidase-like deaminating enzyme n=1 Tax=Variovorax paradoxus TaxID=34073 RepID=A0AAE4BTT3_VARPD|nr:MULTISPECIES: FAD-binding oxidoreductase [Variovorax]MBD9663734.1 FAD-binding oxidoreductase [Variovorax sp. VRV01]MDP9967495.1 glycine/D-amino acid oxidase-like deaminating enzyme [Variovorax paradoxus]MDR6424336.1 glycine/D-amino acid oxidase-like deaminating enzyme [Variovorax paradoxus]
MPNAPQEFFPLAPSLWAATAVPAPATAPLDTDAQADVIVVGAGYCGLSTALHLAERGVRVVVLEAKEIGFGGSGRNGGQVIPGLKHDPSELLRMFGSDEGQRLVDFAKGTADAVFDLIDKHGMDVPRARQGWIQGAHTPAAVQLAERRARDWQMQGVAARQLDRNETARLLGTDKYFGGWLDPRGGGVQPLSYARELARAAQAAGVVIHTGTPVTQLTQAHGKWQAATARGQRVTAERVVMCTNGYTDGLWPGLRKTIINANSFQVATEPLPEAIRKTVLPEGHVSSDARNLLLYYRLDHAGRLLMGGRGTFREPDSGQPGDWSHLEHVVAKLFPQAAGVPIAYRWCGHVAITRDYLPHLHEPAPGLLIDIGCQGRGVGLQTRMGQALAQYIATGDRKALPVQPSDMRPFPLYGLRRLYVSAVIGWYRMTDGGV